MTCAGYPQIVLVARSPRSISPGNRSCRAKIFTSKTIRIQRAARDMNTIMADPYPIRPITADEYAGFRRVNEHAFNGGLTSEVQQARRLRQFEPERSLAAFDTALSADEALVGCPQDPTWHPEGWSIFELTGKASNRAVPYSAEMASHKSVVKVAIPQCRGR